MNSYLDSCVRCGRCDDLSTILDTGKYFLVISKWRFPNSWRKIIVQWASCLSLNVVGRHFRSHFNGFESVLTCDADIYLFVHFRFMLCYVFALVQSPGGRRIVK